MSEVIITCGVCQNSYPKEQFVLCNNGREVCVGCADSQGGAVRPLRPQDDPLITQGEPPPGHPYVDLSSLPVEKEVEDVPRAGDEPANPSDA